MIFISSLLALILLIGFGVGTWLQRDTWFLRWLDLLQARSMIASNPVLSLALAVVVPAIMLALVVYVITYFFSNNWLFFIYVPVLLYCLGRGDLTAEVNHYLALARRGDTVAASQWVDNMRSGTLAEAVADDNREVEDWQQLHAQALDIVSYRSFERLFAVLFWFFILGAAGALLYRLSVIYRERTPAAHAGSNTARRWLWLLEWPGARALSLTWALVGNFDSCYRVMKNDMLDQTRSALGLLSRSLRGALGMTPAAGARIDLPSVTEQGPEPLAAPVINGIHTEPDLLGLMSASLSIFTRSLWLWMCFMALVTISF